MKKVLSAAAVLILLAGAMLWQPAVYAAVMEAGERCVCVLVPSLYFFSILAAYCTGSGLLRAVTAGHGGRASLWAVLFFSQLGGYPAGAQLLHGMRLSGQIMEREERRMLCICIGCGPGFVLGTVCRGLPAGMGMLVLLAVSVPNLLLAPLLMRGIRTAEHPDAPAFSPSAVHLTQAAERAAEAMLKICAMVLAFAAVTGMLTGAGLLPEKAFLMRSILEISNVTAYMHAGGSLPMAAALLSFGGLCVHLQTAAICGGMDWLRFWGVRLGTAAMSWGLCRMGLVLTNAQLPAFLPDVPAPALSAGSAVPGVCLLVMSVLLLRRGEENF